MDAGRRWKAVEFDDWVHCEMCDRLRRKMTIQRSSGAAPQGWQIRNEIASLEGKLVTEKKYGDLRCRYRVDFEYQESHETTRDSQTLTKGCVYAFDCCTLCGRDDWPLFSDELCIGCISGFLHQSDSVTQTYGR